jgi:hypothetical protein
MPVSFKSALTCAFKALQALTLVYKITFRFEISVQNTDIRFKNN